MRLEDRLKVYGLRAENRRSIDKKDDFVRKGSIEVSIKEMP